MVTFEVIFGPVLGEEVTGKRKSKVRKTLDTTMKRTQILIYDEQLRWLRIQAATRGISMAQLVRDCIDCYHDTFVKNKQSRNWKKNSIKAIGAFSSNKSDGIN